MSSFERGADPVTQLVRSSVRTVCAAATQLVMVASALVLAACGDSGTGNQANAIPGGAEVSSAASGAPTGPLGGVGGVGGGAIPDRGGNSVAGGASQAGSSGQPVAGTGGTTPGIPAEACALYVSPSGEGALCDAQNPCSLFSARDKVRELNTNLTADLHVCLQGGTYSLSEPFVLSENDQLHDSGTNGFLVVYRALDATDRPVLSGGRVVTGFEVHDAAKGIFRASVPGLTARQLFVDGRRATRARSKDNYGMVINEHGFTANTTALASFTNPTRIEVTGELDWRHYRCPVETITGTNVRLQDPCWSLSQDIKSGWWNFKKVSWVENAYELLDEPGEFYFDEEKDLLLYKPRAGEDLKTATVVVPVLETLVRGQGSVGRPLTNIAFRDLTFAYGTWNGSNGSLGYTSRQSGFLHRTLKQYSDYSFYAMPSNLVFERVQSLRFENNVFRNLGASGVDIFQASSGNSIVGNRFEDISGRAITLGHINDADAPETEMIADNVIRNNAIFHSGVEYRDCSIIFIGYTRNTLVEHNWLRYGPYTGISLGWGWTSHPDSKAGDNLIRWNRIEDFMLHTFDGSGVYALGVQRGSSVDHNYIYRGLPRGEGIFPDQGAAHMSWESNVIEDVGYQWIHDWSAQAHHNTIRHNVTNQPNFEHKGGAAKQDIFEDNIVVTDGAWPKVALDTKAKAGLQPDYAHVGE